MNWFNLKQFGGVCAVLIFAALANLGIDGLSSDSQSSGKNDESETTLPQTQVSLLGNDFSPLLTRLEALTQRKKKTAEEIAAEQREASQQAPVVDAVDKTLRPNFVALDDEHQFGLVGVFDGAVSFAVLQTVNYASGATEYVKLTAGQKIGKYEVASIATLSVSLRSGDSELMLKLFNTKNNS